MARSIPTKQQPLSAATSQLNTPNATPPTSGAHAPLTGYSEGRLQQLLAHFDCGTHEFDRADRETPFDKQMTWGEDFPNAPPQPQHQASSSRRPSFLSSLNLTTRFGALTPPPSNPASGTSTPAHTPISTSHPNLPSNLKMTPSSSSSPPSPTIDPIQRPHSTPTISTSKAPAESVIEKLRQSSSTASPVASEDATVPAPPMMMQRSNTLPGNRTAQGALGFSFLHRKASIGQGMGAKPVMTGLSTIDLNQEPQRHFDPSKEPRLLGLL